MKPLLQSCPNIRDVDMFSLILCHDNSRDDLRSFFTKASGKRSLLRWVLAVLILTIAAACSPTEEGPDDGPPPIAQFELVFSEEFDGTELNTDIWEIQLGDGKAEGLERWGNEEEQFYSADNIRVEDGDLIITSRAETVTVTDPDDPVANVGTYDYTSGRLRTQGNVEVAFGRIEARIKMPATQGIWSAFWLLGSDTSPYKVWAAKGEIDIVETYARGLGNVPVPFASGAVHFGGPFPHNLFDTSSTLDFENETNSGRYAGGFDFFSDYHVYGIEWDEEEIRWYIDGFNYYSVKTTNFYGIFSDQDSFLDPPDSNRDTFKYSSPSEEGLFGLGFATSETAPFDSRFGQSFHILLNSAVGGTLPNAFGEPPSVGDFAAAGDEMRVDWVRVYRCNLADPDLEEPAGHSRCKNNELTEGQGRPGIAIPDDPINPDEKIFSNFANDFLAASSTVYDFFFDGFFVFTDGPDAEDVPNGPALNIEAFGDATWELATDEASINPTPFIRVLPSAAGLQGVAIVGEDELILSGIREGLSDIKFDLYIEEEFDGAVVDQAYLENGPSIGGDTSRIARIAITSGDDNSGGNFLFLPLDEIGAGNWRRFHIPLNFLTNNGTAFSGGAVNLGDVNRFLEIAVAGVNLRIDNLVFVCGAVPCGVVGEVEVFVDDIDPIWDRGIVGDDTFERFRVPSNADYTDPDCCHVQWELVDLPPGNLDFEGNERNTVVQTSFGTNGTEGAVNFIGATQPFPSIAALTEGEFQFDMRIVSNPNDVDLIFKIDERIDDVELSSTGEQPLGRFIRPGEEGPGEVPNTDSSGWRAFRCPISTLGQTGINLAGITSPFILVPGNRGAGQGLVVQWDNVRFTTSRSSTPVVLDLPITFADLASFCLPIAPFAGGGFAVVENPQIDAGNGPNENNSPRVGQVRKFGVGEDGVTFGGISLNLSEQIVFDEVTVAGQNNRLFEIKTYATRVGLPLSFKLESNLGDGRDLTRVLTTTVANQWETLSFDFNGTAANEFSSITMILDDGVVGDGSEDFQLEFDQIVRSDSMSSVASLADVNGVPGVLDFDAADTVYPLTDFGEARSSVIDINSVADLADTRSLGVNGVVSVASGNVGAVSLADFAQTFAGTTLSGFNGFPDAIPLDVMSGRTVIQMDVYSPTAGSMIELKVEDAVDANQAGSVFRTVPVANQWVTLTFDFAEAMLRPEDVFEKLNLFFEPGVTRTGKTFYYDNIQVLNP